MSETTSHLSAVPDPEPEPVLWWGKGIWTSIANLPTPEFEMDATDPHNNHVTGRYRLRQPNGEVNLCSITEYQEAMQAQNDAVTGKQNHKASYKK